MELNEGKKQVIQDLWTPDVSFEISEASPEEAAGNPVLAKVKGTFFVPNGTSRNKRFYPKELWEKVVKDNAIRQKLVEKRMLGTIGHNQPINDDAVREGKFGHIVTNLTIEGDKGIGEAFILDTPVGRVLNTLLRAGSKLFVSSRANGAFKGEENGIPRVDPETYILDTFDFVIDPGFIQANPSLVESLIESISESSHSNQKGDNQMALETLVEQLSKEKGSLETKLADAAKEVETLKNENTVLVQENAHYKEKQGKLEEMETLLKKYQELGSVEQIVEVLKKADEQYEAYKALGKPEAIDKAFESGRKVIGEYRELGSVAEIKEAFEKSDRTLKAYRELGSVPEIREAFSHMDKQIEEARKAKLEAKKVEEAKKISDFAKELGISEDKVQKVWGKMTEAEIRELFKDVKPAVAAPVVETFRKKEPTKKIDESKNEQKPEGLMKKSSGQRLMESLV